MRTFALSALALAAAVAGGAAFAQSVNPGVAQLAASAGVSPEGFTQSQIIRLLQAQQDNDQEAIRFILSQQSSSVSRSDMGGVTPGAVQLANSLGVDASRYTLDELIRLERAKQNNDDEAIRFILSGEVRNQSGIAATNPGAQQLAAALGVNAADYSLAELTAAYDDRFGNN